LRSSIAAGDESAIAATSQVKGRSVSTQLESPLPATKNSKTKDAVAKGDETEATDAIALLEADHRKVEKLFAEAQDEEDPTRKAELVLQICTELMIHSTVEEELLYPACSAIEDQALVDEAYVEHDGAKVLIAELIAAEPEDDFYDAKVKVLSELIKHHVKEEEEPKEGLFAQARAADLDLDAIGAAIAARKEELMAEFADGDLPPPETRSYSGHELVQGEPLEEQEAA
jgi:hemerythrin superfamily protein